ncbi:uncharacterized protein MYCFIDRAFT_195657 [Pseudocercospora fijiensis CIRAD86]|uniref:Uncharacterized protein n=1 Tax=Pseudocercospora fijiensis (strain CIRAD86) TaxID=383855 RepID=M3AJB0_PSEFD|nr:uncharacterized protein MYCFIDRAFT_195657 [Pseudocercospora fijiensis CIRAD86]EME84671.1 hypothetical protein MYCFIDRAFT_195657 [Pseudocercospora fijiensis CIRAD86]
MPSCWGDSGWWLACRRLLAVPARYQPPRLQHGHWTMRMDRPGIGQQSEDRSGGPRAVGNGDVLTPGGRRAEARGGGGGEEHRTDRRTAQHSTAQQKREVVGKLELVTRRRA